MKRSGGSSSPERRRVSIEENGVVESSISIPMGQQEQAQPQVPYTGTSNGYNQYASTTGSSHDALLEDMGDPTTGLHSRIITNESSSKALSSRSRKGKTSLSSRKVKRKGVTMWKRFYKRWVTGVVPSFSSLFLAVVLWYGLGVLSIGTSKLLLTNNDQDGQHHGRHHHHPLIGGLPPLFLTLQQLVIGSFLLRFLLQIRFLGSPGLAPWPSSHSLAAMEHSAWSSSTSRPSKRWAHAMPSELVLAGGFFSVGFLMTNYGFSGSSASFVETIKAAEPITSATVAVCAGIEVLSRNEVVGLTAIVLGVVLSTVGNNNGTEDASSDSESDHSSHALWKSANTCAIVLVANLCFSFRGLYQKLFRALPEGSAQVIDDLNLQFRMQQTGIALLVVPVVLWEGRGVLRHLWLLQMQHGLWSSGVTSQYMSLALLNGFAFTAYNLASTYILSRISVVHHAALNCLRRVFAIVITSLYFVVPITFLGSIGILISFGGFMFFTHYKVQRQRQPRPLSSLLPVSLAE